MASRDLALEYYPLIEAGLPEAILEPVLILLAGDVRARSADRADGHV